jgi:hypothetical protein
MPFHVTHRYGEMESDPPRSRFAALLQELDDRPEDAEHTSVSVTHETEWCLSAYSGGYLVFENLEGNGPRHMTNLSPEKIVELWDALAEGDLDSIEQEPWKPGY